MIPIILLVTLLYEIRGFTRPFDDHVSERETPLPRITNCFSEKDNSSAARTRAALVLRHIQCHNSAHSRLAYQLPEGYLGLPG
jgi:hypothetical protein